MAKKKHQDNILRVELKRPYVWLLMVVALFIFAFFAFGTAVYAMRIKYQDKIWPNVTLAGVNIGGLEKHDAISEVRDHINAQYADGLSFKTEEKTISVSPTVIATDDPDVSIDLVDWQVEESVDKAYQVGRSGIFSSIFDLQLLFSNRNLKMEYDWKPEEVKGILLTNFEGLLEEKKESQLYFEVNEPKLTESASGITYNFDEALSQAGVRFASLSRDPVNIKKKVEQPSLTVELLTPYLDDAKQAIDFETFKVIHEDQEYLISANQIKPWLQFRLTANGSPRLTVAGENYQTWLDNVKEEVETDVQNAKFSIENGRAVEFQGSRNGVKVVDEKLQERFENNILSHNDIILPTEIVEPDVKVGDVNDLGIEEILGTGISDFSGSPVNRRHNIKVGADTLNGIIIAPGEEFSLIDALGEIDATNGYRQELVIKGDKTIPEYGGGLCQIGTTTFRATLASGLPVTARRNHSYSVSYYYPAGTDATIYDPWPDYKFLNDTGSNVLIQTRMEDDLLYFDFWGKKDGRKVEQTEPVHYNFVQPEPTKYIETLDLNPGQVKCTESAHVGLDAYFDYTVTYPDGEVKDERFTSHYRPWREVCLIGVEELSDPETPETTDEGETQTTQGNVIINSLN